MPRITHLEQILAMGGKLTVKMEEGPKEDGTLWFVGGLDAPRAEDHPGWGTWAPTMELMLSRLSVYVREFRGGGEWYPQ